MRNALILLAVVALLVLLVGALNHGTMFEIDYVAGTIGAVSLLRVAAVLSGLLFVAGLAAVWLALSSAAGARRKLEAELQRTYERLRAAEARAARPALEAEPAVAPSPTPDEAATAVVQEAATAVSGEEPTAAPDAEATATEATAATRVADDGDRGS